MHSDALEVPTGSVVTADVCIVGGGAAGITLALELARTKLRVWLLEAGGYEADADTQRLTEVSKTGRAYSADTRLRFFGGNTNHWGGHCVPLRAINFERLPWSRHSGWPFGLETLLPYYRRAHRQLRLGPLDYDAAAAAAGIGAGLFPFDASRVETVVSRYRAVRFGTEHRDALTAAPNVTVCTRANVVSLDLARAGERIESVSVRTLAGTSFSVRASQFVLATGGIENARLLLASDDVQREGLGNRHDLVGRYFMEHIWYPSGAIVPAATAQTLSAYGQEHPAGDGLGFRFHLALPERVVRDQGIPDFRTELAVFETERYADSVVSLRTLLDSARRAQWPDDMTSHIANIATGPGAIVRHLISPGDGPTVYRLLNYVEQAPNPDSRIVLSRQRDALGVPRATVDWRLSAIDREGIRKAHSLIAAEVGRSGFGRMKIELDPGETELLAGADGGYHHMGTTRMHADPRQGVVDPDCRIHGLRNAYVAGSSVFPTAGYANPTLTIVALAIRLADHLKELDRRGS